MVGVAGFEPATPSSRTKGATTSDIRWRWHTYTIGCLFASNASHLAEAKLHAMATRSSDRNTRQKYRPALNKHSQLDT
jgi:hypothetical protein